MYKWAATQLLSLLLTIAGVPVVLFCLLYGGTWPGVFWIWYNDDDGYGPNGGTWNAFVWLALRNPVANLRHVSWVPDVGGPLYYRTWFWGSRQFYYKFGYLPNNGWPCLSLGSGRGY